VMSDIKGRVVVMLLCCVVMLEQDVAHLKLQSNSGKGRVE